MPDTNHLSAKQANAQVTKMTSGEFARMVILVTLAFSPLFFLMMATAPGWS